MRRYLISVILVFGFYTYIVSGSESCRIPSGKQYSLANFRPQYSSNPPRYRPNQHVRHLTRIVITCKKDIYHDAIRRAEKSRCSNGRWIPTLPSCEVKRRCRAPDMIAHATSSRPLDEYITFPHGGIVEFTCHDGYSSIGSGTTSCNNGVWTDIKFQCRKITPPRFENVPVVENLPNVENEKPTRNESVAMDHVVPKDNRLCDHIKVPYGNVYKVDGQNNRYTVICKMGRRLRGNKKSFTCYEGKWIGAKPACVTRVSGIRKYTGRCKYPFRERRLSFMKSIDTGENIDTYHVQDGTRVTQTCRNVQGVVRRIQCNKGRWLPPLINCRQQRNRLTYRSAAVRNCTIPVSEENVTYTWYNSTGNGEIEYVGGDVIQSGIKIDRKCIIHSIEGALDSSTIETLLCADGDWRPSIRPCQTSIAVQYRVRVKPSNKSDKIPTHVVVTGLGRRRTNLKLQNSTVDLYDVREYDVTAPDIGKVRKIALQTSNPSHQVSVDFISIYKPDIEEYYVSHLRDIHSNRKNKRVCPDTFAESIKWRPDWSERLDYKDLTNLTDAISCNMACVEEPSFQCQASFYDTDQRCYLFKQWTKENLENNPEARTDLYIRHDACVIE
ncbi:Complement receptor type [Mactra antiquata]